jgi:hypothetical protein
MRRILSVLIVLGCLSLAPARAAEGEIKLFNGKDLKGWKVWTKEGKGDWKVKDGLLSTSGKPFGYIITDKEHGDYKLTVEWRWDEGAKDVKGGPNSGVLLHCSGEDKIWPKCCEAQLWSGNAGDFWLVGGFKLNVDKERQDARIDRHYWRMMKDKKFEKPLGEWNKYEIICKGDTITLFVNGTKLNEGKGSELKKGKIALQAEGAPISFRTVTITPLK